MGVRNAAFSGVARPNLIKFLTILIQLFSGSIRMISLGIIGYYIAKIYEGSKGRPRYIISDTCDGKDL